MLVLSAQVKSEYAQLKEALGAVTQERDLALWERNQLQGKLENLEQVLKVRKLAQRADRRYLSGLGAIPSPCSPSFPGILIQVFFFFMEPNPLPVPLLLPVLHCFHLVIFHYTV